MVTVEVGERVILVRGGIFAENDTHVFESQQFGESLGRVAVQIEQTRQIALRAWKSYPKAQAPARYKEAISWG